MKRHLLTVLLFCLAGAISVVALPQDNSNANQQTAPQAAPEHHRGRHFDPQRRTEMLTKRLNLTSDQQSKVLDILKSEQSQMQSLHSDTSTAPEDRRSKMMDIHKTSSDEIRALLNADQQKKWDEMQSRRQQWQGHEGMQKPPSDSPQN